MCVAPLVAWRPRSEPWRVTSGVARANHDRYGGRQPAALTLKYPIRHGTVTNWDDTPIHKSHALHQAVFRLTGRDPAEYLMKSLTGQGYSFTATAEREIARDVKEKLRCIGADNNTELKSMAEAD